MDRFAELIDELTRKKTLLDARRPLPKEVLHNLEEWYRIETTYSSNALEGNTLTASETAIVVEKGLTIGGKTVREHLEAINHAHAFDYILGWARDHTKKVTLHEIRTLHQLVLKGIQDEGAGGWRKVYIKVSGSAFEFPAPWEIEERMADFIEWLQAAQGHPMMIAAEAHLRLVTIHPFVDGNGRTARLLMNLMLIRAGYPPAVIRPEIRKAYIDSLVDAQLQGDSESFYWLMAEAVSESLNLYLKNTEPSPS
jgi:Fic family protein